MSIMTLNRKVVKIISKDVNDMTVEEIIDSFPDEKIKEAVKNVYNAAYKKGLMIGAYSISTIVLRKLKGSKNPALAVANTIKFLKSNKHIESYDKQQKEIIEKGF